MTSSGNQALLQRLLATFAVEADERLNAMSAILLELARRGAAEHCAQLIETLFREVHSLKGAARAVNRDDIEAICQTLESALASAKCSASALSPALLDMFDERLDELTALLAGNDASGAHTDRSGETAVETLRNRASSPSLPLPGGTPRFESVRISTARLEGLHAQAEALTAYQYSLHDLVQILHVLAAMVAQFRKSWSKPAGEARRRQRAREQTTHERDGLTDEILRAEDFVRIVADQLSRLQAKSQRIQHAMSSATAQLQDDIRQALMLPFAFLLDMLPKLVHDLARDSGKLAELRVEGGTTGVDRRILEQLKDPLIHLIRNAIDHGIEHPDERQRRGKPRAGLVRLAVMPRDGNKVEMVLADDGVGIDLATVTAAAIRTGLVAPDNTLDMRTALDLLFESGLSTIPTPTALSGRGLGLAIVREQVTRLGGRIEITQPSRGGCEFHIVVPSTLAAFRGVIVSTVGRHFVVPLRNLVRVTRVDPGNVKTVENCASVEVDGEVLALVYLADVLGLVAADALRPGRYLYLALLENGAQRIALGVDEVVGDQEVQVRGLGPQLERVRNIAGATVLGDGRVALVLSVPDLFESASRASTCMPAQSETSGARQARRSLLVVEDSITSRSMLKSILESAGFDVTTAVDGLEGLAAARSGTFDLVLSDVDMPRMNGFEMTTELRRDKRLSDLPVVLVSTMDSREDKARGLEVGANAYIVKGSFEQSDLLETIRGLL
ncbi:hybrid sensor histidine kinase/response regulator [Burkholderia sp. JP2-270]|uniref:hybrid sensor histidine kinase/response regulator n=1 Tax=Burkholderia sp. JP2-270 TaxID=2217913 RepID=UPI000DA31F66|nr:response regulator [Burkholderia sp. JP2-270]AWV05074.1 hybrid sensor histidine kinase/response regulator [Burkholderia sp. JP2-270]